MTAETIAKRTVGALAVAPVLASRTRSALGGRTAIVGAHYIGEWTPHYSAFYSGSTVDGLQAELTRLKRWFDFAHLSEVLAFNRGEIESDRPLLAVTFDDGFDMIGNGVVDVLADHGVRATTFILTSTVDNANLMWRNKLCAIQSLRPRERYVKRYNELAERTGQLPIVDATDVLAVSLKWPMDRKEELADELWGACDMPPLDEYLEEYKPYFTWDGLRDWMARGHGVGFHSDTHPLCWRLSEESLWTELIEPVPGLRARLGVSSLPFSYPFGRRVDEHIERRLYAEGHFDCLLGIGGFSPRGTPPDRLERASFERHAGFPVFGRAFLGLPRAPAPGDSGRP